MNNNSITVEELKKRLESGENLVLLDVRDEEKFLQGSLQWNGTATRNIPYVQMRDQNEEALAALDTLPHNAMLITLCTSGNKANKAATLLNESGLKAVSLEGGLTAWKNTGQHGKE
ncbi:MAG: rhodanese-like domain-containing protein [Clostridia bacterium]